MVSTSYQAESMASDIWHTENGEEDSTDMKTQFST